MVSLSPDPLPLTPLPGTLLQDIEKVCASGHPVHEIRAFTIGPVPVASRHRLETETQEMFGVRLELHDAESIASLLAQPEGFWIAERFLSIPAEIRPEPPATEGDLSDEYMERRTAWRDKGAPNPTLGDLIDLKAGLRYVISQPEARGDLPFWFGLVRNLLANPECPDSVRQRARYELAVTTFLGTSNLRQVDDVVRAYLDESLKESVPARMQDASALLLYANTAVQWGVTSLTPAGLGDWNRNLTKRVRDLVVDVQPDEPHRRANLLYVIGLLGLHPPLWEADTPAINGEEDRDGCLDRAVELPDLDNISLPDNFVLAEESQTLSAWTELMEGLEETPLFPVQSLADILQLLVPLWSKHAEWRKLLDLAVDAIGDVTPFPPLPDMNTSPGVR